MSKRKAEADANKKATNESHAAAAAASSSSAAAVASLDPDDAKASAAAAAADSNAIQWIVMGPAKYADIEMVQADLACGVRMPVVDVARLESPFLDTLLEAAHAEKSSRIYIPDGTFKTVKLFNLCVALMSPGVSGGDLVSFHHSEICELLHGANVLAVMKVRQFVALIDTLKTSPCLEVSGVQLIDAGTTYYEPTLVKKGAMRLASEIAAKPDMEVADTTLRKCYQHWLSECHKMAHVRQHMDAFYEKIRAKGVLFECAYAEAVHFTQMVSAITIDEQ